MAITVCLHNKFGFCKYGEHCRKEHVEVVCENEECTVNECSKRHPRPCKYFREFGKCKFSEICAFSHNVSVDPIERRMDPCSDPEFELHNHIDYARQSCFLALGS